MVKTVRARFSLSEDTRTGWWHSGEQMYQEAAKIRLTAVKGEPFGPATPSGAIDMLIVNPEAIQIFREAKLGQQFDCILVPVPDEAATPV